ncbi:MAG: hypothetical protein PHG06_00535 [Parabacteroides sp.]|nr:hypothetical protein [Parabacteroides sp.]
MGAQPEFELDKRNVALNHYFDEVKLSHKGTPEDSLHVAFARGMRRMLYDLGVIDKNKNHDIVVMAIAAAETEIKKAQKKRQGK